MKEERSNWEGLVEIWVDGEKKTESEVRLKGYVDVIEVRTLNGTDHLDGGTTWEAHVFDLEEHQRFSLLGRALELKFPDGQIARAVLKDSKSSLLSGIGETPFPR